MLELAFGGGESSSSQLGSEFGGRNPSTRPCFNSLRLSGEPTLDSQCCAGSAAAGAPYSVMVAAMASRLLAMLLKAMV